MIPAAGTFQTLTQQGCFTNDLETQINSNFAAAPNVVYSYSASVGFAVFNGGAAVNMLAATAPAGTYRFTLYGITKTTFVTNTEETITLGWTDDDAAETVVWTTAALTAGTQLPPVSSTVSNSVTFRSNGTAAVTWTPAVTGSNATAGAMAISIVLERLI
jgi:hypothetical protein